MCSEDLAEFVETNHLDLAVENTTPFNPRDAFGSHSDSDHVYNTPRAWDMQRFLNPYDGGVGRPGRRPQAHLRRHPVGPSSLERKVTIEDIEYVLSSHYQGSRFRTPYGQLGDERTRHMYRTIGINRQSQLAVTPGIRRGPPAGLPRHPVDGVRLQPVQHAGTVLPEDVDTTPAYLEDTTTRVTLPRTSTGPTASSPPCAMAPSAPRRTPLSATRRRPARWATAWSPPPTSRSPVWA